MSAQAPGQEAAAAGAAAGAPTKAVPRRSSLDLLFRDASLAAAATGVGLGMAVGLGVGMGSQDVTGLLLEPALLQHMQSLPRECRVRAAHRRPAACPSPAAARCRLRAPPCPAQGGPSPSPALHPGPPLPPPLPPPSPAGMGTGIELDLLSSPKWKALLSWEADAAGGAAMATAGSGDSAAPSSTAVHLHGLEGEGAPVSPGVDQQMSAAALEAAWREAQHAQHAQRTGSGGGGGPAPVLVPQAVPDPPARPPQRPRGFGGKKRPGPDPEAEAQAEAEAEAVQPPPRKRRTEAGPAAAARPPLPPPPAAAPALGLGGGHRLATVSSGDTLMLDAEAAAALDCELGAKEDLSPTDVLTGLTRVRLNSIGSPRTHRRLTAAAAAAAVTPAGRRGRLRRGESNVPMLDAGLPGSPTGAQLLPVVGGDAGEQGAAAAAVQPAAQLQPKPEPLAATTGLVAGVSPADLASAAAVAAACAPLASPAPAVNLSQLERRATTATGRQQLPTKSHKAVPTGAQAVPCCFPEPACVGFSRAPTPQGAAADPPPHPCLSLHPTRPHLCQARAACSPASTGA